MKTMTFAVAGLIAMVAGTSVQATDLTTNTLTDPRPEGRYMVNLGRPGGDTTLWNWAPSGCMEILSGSNGESWHMNDGDPNTYVDTYGGSTPDFLGYIFKLRASTVTGLNWANQTFGDGGTFAAQPDVQYLTNPRGPWQTVPAAEVTFNPPYDSSYDGSVRQYTIELAHPLTNVWGVQLVGACNPGTSGDTNGFVGIGEFTVHGEMDIGDIDLSYNLARGGIGLINFAHYDAMLLVDGDFTTSTDTWYNDRSDGSSAYVGVMFSDKQYRVKALGVWFRRFSDGGYFVDTAAAPLRVEYTADGGATWQDVPNLDKGRYGDCWRKLEHQIFWDVGGGHFVGEQSCFLFRFDELNEIDGLRLIGEQTVGGTWGAPYGFLGAYEVEVFGGALTGRVVNYDGSIDGDVDAVDLGLFVECWSGPTVPYTTSPNCANRDLDKDGDVDLDDFSIFQRCYTGPGVAADPLCGGI